MSVLDSRNSQVRKGPEISHEDMRYFCKVLEELSGIFMKPAKLYILQARLHKRLEANGFASYAEYRQFLETIPPDHPEWESFVNLLTTNKTDFFREPKHFDFLIHKILPNFLKSSQETLKIWSAACSTGEEPYTLAMVLEKHMPKDRYFKILATDIDTLVLSKAQNAVYPSSKLHEIPERYRSAITEGRGNAEGWFRIKPAVKEKVVFKRHNLVESVAPPDDTFDLVLCRNVMIYFDKPSIEFVVRKLYGSTKLNGYFYIGHSESLQAVKHSWTTRGPSIYQKI